jgi:hypothetical protein
MISAGFDDYKKDLIYRTEQTLCKNKKCEECEVEDLCENEKKEQGEKNGRAK